MYSFFIPPQVGLQKILTPLNCRPSPTAGLKMTKMTLIKEYIICWTIVLSDIEFNIIVGLMSCPTALLSH